MKAYSKTELARAAGVSSETFRRWLRNDRAYLAANHITQRTKILPPVVVKYLCEKYDIDLEWDYEEKGQVDATCLYTKKRALLDSTLLIYSHYAIGPISVQLFYSKNAPKKGITFEVNPFFWKQLYENDIFSIMCFVALKLIYIRDFYNDIRNGTRSKFRVG